MLTNLYNMVHFWSCNCHVAYDPQFFFFCLLSDGIKAMEDTVEPLMSDHLEYGP